MKNDGSQSMGKNESEISDYGGINCCYCVFFKGQATFICFIPPYHFVAIKISHQDKWFMELFY